MGKSVARLEVSSFCRYDSFYERFHIVFILLNLNLVNIFSQNFLEIIIKFLEKTYKFFLEFRQILGQQCEKREFSLSNYSFSLYQHIFLVQNKYH